MTGYWKNGTYTSHYNGQLYQILSTTYDEGNVFVNVQWANGETSGDWEWGNFILYHYDEELNNEILRS